MANEMESPGRIRCNFKWPVWEHIKPTHEADYHYCSRPMHHSGRYHLCHCGTGIANKNNGNQIPH